MRVLHLLHGWPPETDGGLERYVGALTRAQAAAGDAPSVLAGSIAPWPRCGIEPVAMDGAVPVRRLHRNDLFFDWHGKAWHPEVAPLVAAEVAAQRPEVVHLHHWLRLSNDLVQVLSDAGTPVVVTLHDAWTTCPRAFRVDRDGAPCRRQLGAEHCAPCAPRYGHEADDELREGVELFAAGARTELRRAAAVLVPHPRLAELVAAQQRLEAATFTTALLPPVEPPPAPTPPAPWPGAGEPMRIAYLGILARHKGVELLVRAFAAACARGLPHDAELHLFGRGETDEFAAELRRLADGLPVHFHGAYHLADVAALRAHVAALPSLSFETWGLVLDECLALGLPALVSDFGVPVARGGAATMAVAAGDVAAWTDAILRLLAEPALRARLVAAVPQAAAAALGPGMATHLRQLAAVYAEAVRRGPRPPATDDVDRDRRAAFLLRQREGALRVITPPGGPS